MYDFDSMLNPRTFDMGYYLLFVTVFAYNGPNTLFTTPAFY